jgi:hypothetical protein
MPEEIHSNFGNDYLEILNKSPFEKKLDTLFNDVMVFELDVMVLLESVA